MEKRTFTTESCNFINLFKDAFALSENLHLVTFMPDDGNICSLLISETKTEILITPQDAASIEMLSGQEEMTKANAKFVFNKENLLKLIGEKPTNLANLTVVMEKHSSIGVEEMVMLINALHKDRKGISTILAQLIQLTTQKVTKLVEYAKEMPALLQETFNSMIQV